MLKILIADDHALVRKGIRQLLAEEYAEAEFWETGTTSETLACLSRQGWDLMVLDIFMPGRGGLEVLHEAGRLQPQVPVLVLSSAPEDQMAVRVLKAGARGYLNKQAAPEELAEAARKILAGERYVSASVADILVQELGRNHLPLHSTLSDREYSVLQLLIAGKSIKEIAAELSLSAKTVSTFHTRIWEKLGVQNDIEMIRYAFDHGLVGPRQTAPGA
jgi:two-component system, NarL family, invasion response regulator UvrY